MQSVNKGLENVYITETTVSLVDGEKGKLYYRGYNIEDLYKYSCYEEVVFLLIKGRLPKMNELIDFKRKLISKMKVTKDELRLINIMKNSLPIDILRTIISYIGSKKEIRTTDSSNIDEEQVLQIISKVSSITTSIFRLKHGKDIIEPEDSISYSENIINMMFNERNKEKSELLDKLLIIDAVHGMNASTFASLVIISTLSDLYSAITGALGALKGPLHGGAGEEVVKTIMGIEGNMEAEIKNMIKAKKRIMGFGHRVYKTHDPRYKLLKSSLIEYSRNKPEFKRLMERAIEFEELASRELIKKNIYPNVDYYASILFWLLGIPPEFHTCIIASSRVSGWLAYILEYVKNNRLIRPKDLYIGNIDLKYVPIDQRF